MKTSVSISLVLLVVFQLAGPNRLTADTPPAGRSRQTDGSARAGESAENATALHVAAGAAAALLASAVAYPLVNLESGQNSALMVAGLGVCGALAAGVFKELWDCTGAGQPEWADLFSTAAGGIAAAALVYTMTRLHPCGGDGCGELSAVYAGFAVILSLPVGESLYRRFSLSSRSRS